jgi:hypothetical protein
MRYLLALYLNYMARKHLGIFLYIRSVCVYYIFLSTQLGSNQKQKQKLTAGKQPARSILAPGPAGTHGHILVQCRDLCFVLFFLSLILLIEKGGVGLLYIYIYRMVFTYYTLLQLRLLFPPLRGLEECI